MISGGPISENKTHHSRIMSSTVKGLAELKTSLL